MAFVRKTGFCEKVIQPINASERSEQVFAPLLEGSQVVAFRNEGLARSKEECLRMDGGNERFRVENLCERKLLLAALAEGGCTLRTHEAGVATVATVNIPALEMVLGGGRCGGRTRPEGCSIVHRQGRHDG